MPDARHLPPGSFLWPAEPDRRPLDRARLVRAALDLLDDVGLEALSMRRLAERLEVRSASLYWHVRDKGQLLDLVADAICGEMVVPPPTGDWRADLSATAQELRRVLKAHRDAAAIVASTLPFGPNRLRLADAGLGHLLAAGFEPRVAAYAGLLMTDYVTNFVIEEQRAKAMLAAFGASDTADALAALNQWFQQLPADQFPHLVRLAPYLAEPDTEARFQFGIRTLLDGLSATSSQQ